MYAKVAGIILDGERCERSGLPETVALLLSETEKVVKLYRNNRKFDKKIDKKTATSS